jgi:hypothetical protein
MAVKFSPTILALGKVEGYCVGSRLALPLAAGVTLAGVAGARFASSLTLGRESISFAFK